MYGARRCPVILMAAKRPEDLLLCHAFSTGPCGQGQKQVLRSLRSHQDDILRSLRSHQDDSAMSTLDQKSPKTVAFRRFGVNVRSNVL